jgi:hypothetical protein
MSPREFVGKISKGDFRLQGNKLLCVRLGPMNAQRQDHREGNTAPANRGYWAFPWPHQDAFFYYHKWEEFLPKRLRDEAMEAAHDRDKDEWEKLCAEREQKMRDIQKREKLSTFWCGGPFYSHILPNGQPGNWHLWQSPTDWAREARKHLWTNVRVGERLMKVPYAADHLELFIPIGR